MYRAKLAGADVARYEPEFDDHGNRLRLAEELRTAVHGGELALHFQPQLDLSSGQVRAVEALVRWPHARLGLVPPLSFLPLAEEAHLMGPLTEWVLTTALEQCARWRREGRELAVSVNVSASNLLQDGFTELISAQLQRFELPPGVLVLEITETSIIEDFERSRAVIAALHELGVVVSVDDFGAGFTSLAYLSSLAVGELKLDRSFITGLTGGGPRGRDVPLVRATIELGHALGLRVVTEGIEDAETLELLTELGCDLVQGYFIGRPAPADQLTPLLAGAAHPLAA
jgi:EAL domain-containing protein (putative c-di-GMP-specific phosphodiesterase class I)